jgi:hypothetical protein
MEGLSDISLCPSFANVVTRYFYGITSNRSYAISGKQTTICSDTIEISSNAAIEIFLKSLLRQWQLTCRASAGAHFFLEEDGHSTKFFEQLGIASQLGFARILFQVKQLEVGIEL